MIRVISQLDDGSEDWNNIFPFTSQSLKIKGKDCIIHYLNEPDRQGTTPQEAVKAWKEKITNLRKKGVKVIGPACASDKQGEKWIGEFMRLLKEESGEEPDFMGVHYYGEDVEEAIKYLRGVRERFPEMRVVVSEVGCTSREYEVVVRFTGVLCNCKSLPLFSICQSISIRGLRVRVRVDYKSVV